MTFPEYKTVITRISARHLSIILNRPEKRNALNDAMVAELNDVFMKSFKEKQIRTISIQGSGKAFCSGADLEYLKKIKNYDTQTNLNDSLKLSDLFLRIYRSPKPVIAIVHGPALAGGCGLASVCDFIIATHEAKFGYPEVKIGFIGALVSVFLIRQIGERKARDLLLSGRIIKAHEALQLGMINKVVPESDLQAQIDGLINDLTLNSPMALTESKKLLDSFNFTEIEEELKAKAQMNAEFRQTPDFQEGLSSFFEKRKPNWD
jgi:methylglutaconyl-CoA hydratase